MNLPETCPFCGSFAELRNGEKWVGFTCITTIHAGHDARRLQSATCAGLERTRLLARVAELEARDKQACEDEAWANERTVLVEFQPVTSGWYASASDGVVGINATATTIHGALRALREKMEARPAEKATPCPYCLRVECECSDFDVAPDMGDK